MKIHQIKFKIFKDEKFQTINCRQHINIISGNYLELEILFQLIKKIFLSPNNDISANYLHLLKERTKRNASPEIIITLKVGGQSKYFHYVYEKDQYFINSKKPVGTKKEYFYELIRFLKYKDYPDSLIQLPSSANTRLKKLRACMIADVTKPNVFLFDRNYEFDLFFDSENNISLKILIKVLKKELGFIENKLKGKSNRLPKIEIKLKELESNLNLLKEFELRSREYENLIAEYKTKKAILQEIESLVSQLKLLEEGKAIKDKITNLYLRKQELTYKINNKNQELRKIEIQISRLISEQKHLTKKIEKLQKEQRSLDLVKIRWKNRVCYCGNDLPENNKNKIEATGKCPICSKNFNYNKENEIQGIQQEINKKRQKIKIKSNKIEQLSNQIIQINDDIEDFELKITNIEQKINEYKSLPVDNKKIKELKNHINSLKKFEWDFDKLLKHDEIVKDINSEINNFKEFRNYLERKIIPLKQKQEDIISFINYIKDQSVNIKENLKTNFDAIQKKIIKKFIKKKVVGIKIIGRKDFSEINIEFQDPSIDHWIIHLNYYLSILELSLSQNLAHFNNFRGFPFLTLKGIQNLSILKKVIDYLISLKKKNFQIIIFQPNLKTNEIQNYNKEIFVHRIKNSKKEQINFDFHSLMDFIQEIK